MISHDRKCLPQIFQPNQLAFLIPLVILLIGLTITPAESSSMSIIPPLDETVTGTSTWTKVALGSPKVIGSTDSTPTISHDAPGSTSPPAGAAAYWSFDYGLEDASGKGNNGVAEGNAQIVRNYIGNSLSLDGDKDDVTVKDSSTLRQTGAFTLSAWVNLDTLSPPGGYSQILEKGTDSNRYYMSYIKSSKEIAFGFMTNGVVSEVKTL